jgi:LysR family transcriptional regulator of abg operon
LGATSISELLKYSWTMPTPRGSYYKQLEEVFNNRAQFPNIGVVCETFSSSISLVAQSDFLSILPQELGCDPLLANRLVMLPVKESLPKATYYLIQRRDTRQTPLTASLITQFRRHGRQMNIADE